MAKEAWGGTWTEQKLDAFEKYVNAYLTIMNRYRGKYNWRLIYFDAFAGSGSRTTAAEGTAASNNKTAVKIAGQIIGKSQHEDDENRVD